MSLDGNADGRGSTTASPCEVCPRNENPEGLYKDCASQVSDKCCTVGQCAHQTEREQDFEKELHQIVETFAKHCTTTKARMRKNNQGIGSSRLEVHLAARKLRAVARQTYDARIRQLEENQNSLFEKITELQRRFENDVDAVDAPVNEKTMDKNQNTPEPRVTDDNAIPVDVVNHNEAFKQFLKELDDMLEERTDSICEDFKISGRPGSAIPRRVGYSRRKHASLSKLLPDVAFGSVHPPDDSTGDLDNTLALRKDHGKISVPKLRVHPPDDSTGDLDNTLALRKDHGKISVPKLRVHRRVLLPGYMLGMSRYSSDCVAVGYSHELSSCGVHIVDSSARVKSGINLPKPSYFYDFVFQMDTSDVFMAERYTEVQGYSHGGSKTLIRINNSGHHPRLNRSPSGEILIVNGSDHVFIYDPIGGTLKHSVPTARNTPFQASATGSGLIVTSSCNYIFDNSVVTVYDREGNAGNCLTARDGDHLYADVDDQDRVYVASVNKESGKVLLTLYDIDGLNLKERVVFNELDLIIGHSWCYLVSLSSHILALASAKLLYLIEIKYVPSIEQT